MFYGYATVMYLLWSGFSGEAAATLIYGPVNVPAATLYRIGPQAAGMYLPGPKQAGIA